MTRSIRDIKLRRRSSRTERLTEAQIEEALPEEARPSANRRLTDGGGLSVLIKPNGDKYFQFRSFVDGKEISSLLGKFPDMSLEAARNRAKRMYHEIQRTRSKRKQSSFSVRLVDEPAQADSRQALDMRDVADLLRELDRFFGEGRIDFEVRLAIEALVRLPVTLDKLMSARKSDIDFSTGVWQTCEMHDATEGKARMAKLAIFPANLLRMVYEGSNIINRTDYVFPRLSLLGKRSQSREIQLVLRIACPHQSIKLDDFRRIFRRTAEKKSYFKIELIMAALNHSKIPNYSNHKSYMLQRSALSNWWEQEIDYAKFEK